MRILAPAAALAIVTTLMLGGCVPTEPTASPTPEPSPTPVFASEEEALAAAEDAYAAYLAVSDAITADGGASPERIEPLVTEEQLPDVLSSFDAYASRSLRSQGATQFDTMTLQQYEDIGNGTAEVDVYGCIDVSDVRIFSADGVDVTPSDRVNRVAVELGFVAGADSVVRLARSAAWTGEDFC